MHFLAVKSGGKYIDATAGGGGHSREIFNRGGNILSIDCDPEALDAVRSRPEFACPPAEKNTWRLAQGNFKNIKEIARGEGFAPADGIIFDLGVSTHQLEAGYRGFSFNLEGPLDMRMDPGLNVSAADLVNALNAGELEMMIRKFGDERFAKKIAKAIVGARKSHVIKTANELANIILAVRPRGKFDRTHPATRTFQALRIAVNDELGNLETALKGAFEILAKGGRLVVISFHSGEDRIVKNFILERSNPARKDGRAAFLSGEAVIKDYSGKGAIINLTKKPVLPGRIEVLENSHSHSAKLRAAEKL